MSRSDLNAYYWKMLREFVLSRGVPENEYSSLMKEIHSGFKELYEVNSFSRLNKHDKWEFIQKVEMILAREYGFSLNQDEELKFE